MVKSGWPLRTICPSVKWIAVIAPETRGRTSTAFDASKRPIYSSHSVTSRAIGAATVSTGAGAAAACGGPSRSSHQAPTISTRNAPIHAARRPRPGWSRVLSSRRTFASAGSSFSIGVWTVMECPLLFVRFGRPRPGGGEGGAGGRCRKRMPPAGVAIGPCCRSASAKRRPLRPVTRIPCARGVPVYILRANATGRPTGARPSPGK